MSRMLRYLAPNLVTCLGILFGLLSMIATLEGRFVDAGWLICWAVMLDRVDGFVARTLKASSEFGMQMDSFADLINFGVAPAFLMYVALTSEPALGFAAGSGRTLLLVACLSWVLATVLRLAKFNVLSDDNPDLFFGVPTTVCAGILAAWFLAVLKYLPEGSVMAPAVAFGGPELFPSIEAGSGALRLFPLAMLGGALLEVSNLPMPKIGKTEGKGVTAALLSTVLLGYILGFARTLPEVCAILPTLWIAGFIVWGQLSPRARKLHPGSVFPRDMVEGDDEDLLDLDLPALEMEEDLEHQHQG